MSILFIVYENVCHFSKAGIIPREWFGIFAYVLLMIMVFVESVVIFFRRRN